MAGREPAVRGVTEDAAKPLAGAQVEVVLGGADNGTGGLKVRPPLATSRTDSEGWFRTRELPGTKLLTVVAGAPGHQKRDRSLTLPIKAPVILALPAAGKLDGKVLDPGGHPVAGADIFLLPADRSSALRMNPRYGFAMMMNGEGEGGGGRG